MAAVYGQPMLGRLIPVASFSALVAGFNSTALHTERRRLSLARMTLLSIAAQVVGLVAMVAFALRYRTVWALVVGAVVPAAVTMITSHLYLPGIRNRFRWNRVAAHELFHFGKWIFLSTALAFLGGYSDELLLGGFLSMGELGMYRLASFLAQASVAAVLNLSGRVLFPLYSRLAEMHAEEMRSRVWKYRLLIIMCTFPVLAGFVVFGDVVVDVLYDSRYRHSGWMLQILSVGAMASVMRLTLDPVLLAVGNSFRFTLQLAIRLVILVTLIVLGAVWFGMPGIIWAIALASITEYPVLILLVRRYGVWTPRMDALAVVGGAALIGFGFLLRPFLLNSVVTPFMTGLQRLFMPLIDLLKTLVYLTMMWIS
jgi:O-antigen/teichoic acid export membrane protein